MGEFYGIHIADSDTKDVNPSSVEILPFLRSFALQTSIQGIPWLVLSRGFIKKIFWFLCICASFYGLFYEVDIFFQAFLKWEPSSRVKLQKPLAVYFPAVTLCNSNPIRENWIMYDESGVIPDKSIRTKRATEEKSTGKNTAILMPTLTVKYETMSMIYRFNDTIKHYAGHQLCDVVLQASYNGKILTDIEDSFRQFWNPHYGNCWTFNGGAPVSEMRSNMNLWTSKLLPSQRQIRLSNSVGKTYGLKMTLNLDLDNYRSESESSGWRILVHNQTSVPLPEAEGIDIKPGTSTQIQISKSHKKILNSVDNGIYVAKFSDCDDSTNWNRMDTRNAYSYKFETLYSHEGCRRTCYQKKVMESCGCYDYNYPHEGPAFDSIINASRIEACSYAGVNSEGPSRDWTCKGEIFQQYISMSFHCDHCVESCEEYLYDASISSMQWPTPLEFNTQKMCHNLVGWIWDLVKGNSSTCSGRSMIRQYGAKIELNELWLKCLFVSKSSSNWVSVARDVVGKRFAEVYVYFKTFNYQSVEEFETYSFAELVAYLGGIVGLFFGFSMLTVCEYLLLIVDLIVIGIAKVIHSIRGKGSGSRNEVNPMATTITRQRNSNVPVLYQYPNQSQLKTIFH